MKAKAPKRFTVGYAAQRLSISIPLVYKLLNEGHLRAFKVGRATRITDAAIDECIKTLEREQPYQPAQSAA